MKKLVFFIFIIAFMWTSLPGWPPDAQTETLHHKVIPHEAIRLRILANSDEEKDQQIKRDVRDEVNRVVSRWVADITDIEEARELIQERLPEIDELVGEVLQESDENREYTVDYGKNITFPM